MDKWISLNKFHLFYFCLLVLILSQGIQAINLNNIEVSTNETWFYNGNYTIYIQTTDTQGNYTDIEEIRVTLLQNVTVNASETIRDSKGQYNKLFNIKDINNSFLSFNVTVKEKEMILSEIFEVELSERPFYKDYTNKILNFIETKLNHFSQDFGSFGAYLIVFSFASLTLIVFYAIFIKRNKSNG